MTADLGYIQASVLEVKGFISLFHELSSPPTDTLFREWRGCVSTLWEARVASYWWQRAFSPVYLKAGVSEAKTWELRRTELQEKVLDMPLKDLQQLFLLAKAL